MNHAAYMVHCNLNSNVAWYTMLVKNGLFAANNSIVPAICDGVPRGCLNSQFDIYVLFYYFFPPLIAYNLNIVIIHIVAFIGMYKLLKDYVFKNTYPMHVALLALSFAVLPFWPSGGLSSAGQPLVLWAFFNLLNKEHSWKNWLIIGLFPFYSSLVFSNLFFFTCIIGCIVFFFWQKKQISYIPLLAWVIIFALSVATQYRLFLIQFAGDFHNQRSYITNLVPLSLNTRGMIGITFKLFLKGYYEFYSMQWPVIIITSVLSLFIIRPAKQRLFIGALLFLCLIFSAIWNLKDWEAMRFFYDKIGMLKFVHFRFTCMFPVLWTIIFAFSLYFVLLRFKKFYAISLGIILCNIIVIFSNFSAVDYQPSNFNDNSFYNTYFGGKSTKYKTFDEFFSPTLFNDARSKINYKSGTILCLGFPSEIAQYNGISTAASNYPFLPMEKVQALIDIFAPELKKIKDSAVKEDVYTNFEYYYNSFDKAGNQINDLSLDTLAIKKMHIQYVFSAPTINNSNQLNLSYVCSINNDNNNAVVRRINIYKVN